MHGTPRDPSVVTIGGTSKGLCWQLSSPSLWYYAWKASHKSQQHPHIAFYLDLQCEEDLRARATGLETRLHTQRPSALARLPAFTIASGCQPLGNMSAIAVWSASQTWRLWYKAGTAPRSLPNLFSVYINYV